jgi:hypothetical protein
LVIRGGGAGQAPDPRAKALSPLYVAIVAVLLILALAWWVGQQVKDNSRTRPPVYESA